ncbi:1,2-epoxyphenylacetyl-CoA isomerase [compost metagenome]
MTSKTVTLDIRENIAILTLNRPDVLNSLSLELAHDARAALAQVRANPTVRALVMTGAGRAFCAGAELNDDLAHGQAGKSASETLHDNMLHHFNPWISDLESLPIPVIAAVNGVAAGAGVGIALAADITLAARSASFLLSFAPKLGLVPDMGTSWQLPRRIGMARARGMALLGEKLDAETAATWGLIWQCVPDEDLLDRALAIAKRLASSPRHATHEVRQAFRLAGGNSLSEQLDYERERQCVMIGLPSFQEGVSAFQEKRRPVFDE